MGTGDEHEHHQPFEFSPFLIGLLGIVAGGMMVATYHCIASGCRRQTPTTQNPSDRSQSHQITRSTASSRSTFRLNPVIRYRKDGNEGSCAVCLSEFTEGDRIRVLPECLHKFHAACIDTWLGSQSTCPLCRADAVPPARHVLVPLPVSGEAPRLEQPRLPDFGG